MQKREATKNALFKYVHNYHTKLLQHVHHDHLDFANQITNIRQKNPIFCKWENCTSAEEPFSGVHQLFFHMFEHTKEAPYKCQVSQFF